MYRGMGSGLIFVPMTTLSLSAVYKEEMGTASGLFNMVRTIGGSIGIAILVAMLSSHAQVIRATWRNRWIRSASASGAIPFRPPLG
jgi:hypothetical protein